jgi:hypothetical protein
MALEVADRYPDARAMRADVLAATSPLATPADAGPPSVRTAPSAATEGVPTLDHGLARPRPADRFEAPTVGPPTPLQVAVPARDAPVRRRTFMLGVVLVVIAVAAGVILLQRLSETVKSPSPASAETPAPAGTVSGREDASKGVGAPAAEPAPPADAGTPRPVAADAVRRPSAPARRPRPGSGKVKVGKIPIFRENE